MRPTASRVLFVAGVSLFVAAASACSKGDTEPPVASVSFSAGRTRVPLGSPVDLTYRFDVAPDAKITGDYRVFVHVRDADGNDLPWNDDHDPPIPTSQWRPGQKIEYTRTRFIPVFPYLGEASVEMGLYRGDQRLPLQGLDPADRNSKTREYKVGTITFLPQSENIYLIYKSGWHPEEFSADNPALTWQWTQKSAVLSLRNPRRDVMFYVESDARTDIFPKDQAQHVTVYCNDQPVTTFVADSGAPTLQRIPISAATLGNGENVELRLEVDRTFVPAKLPGGGSDTRELGIRVYHVFVEVR